MAIPLPGGGGHSPDAMYSPHLRGDVGGTVRVLPDIIMAGVNIQGTLSYCTGMQRPGRVAEHGRAEHAHVSLSASWGNPNE